MNKLTTGDIFSLGIIAILFVLIIWGFYMAMKTSEKQRVAKLKRKRLMADTNSSLLESFQHFNGLPIPEGTMCTINSQPTKYTISSNGANINLDKNKVIDICIKTDVEIQKQYVSSAAGAIGGAILFGPIGALIGGRAKEKKTQQIFSYLIFTYLSGEDMKYIAFNATNSVFIAAKYVDEFKKSHQKSAVEINL